MALSLPSMKERSALGTPVGPTFLEIADKVLSNVLSTYALDPKRYENPFAPDTDSKVCVVHLGRTPMVLHLKT